MLSFRSTSLLFACSAVVFGGSAGALQAEDESAASKDSVAASLSSFKSLNLIGQFSVDRGEQTMGSGKAERYEITEVVPARNGLHLVQARIKYGPHDVTVPIPVKLHESGPESVVMSLDDLSIPLLGDKFYARVVFDFGSSRYAGTWRHGKVGGHMWGRLEHTVPENEVLVLPEAKPVVPQTNPIPDGPAGGL